jgi:hypothetical protein
MASYSVKFQGCHDIKQWNADADEDNDVRISTTSLIRFRLCPSGSCSATKAAGCTAGYGDYVVDSATFMNSYFEAVKQNTEAACESYLYLSCNCEDSDDKDDGFDEEYCEYDCFNDSGMTECIDRNPYTDDEAEDDRFEIEEYMECSELEINNDNRRLEENEDEEEVKYYVGPYCANQGGAIYMGLFTDDTCTTPSTGVSFLELMGFQLPYTSSSVVKADCLTCIEPVNQDEQNDDQEDADAVSESCETMYTYSGKCENNYNGMVANPNTAACNYMDGITITRQDGIINTSSVNRSSAVATSFTVISAGAFASMAFYVWYLRTRLGVKQNTLL